MTDLKKIEGIRREYGNLCLDDNAFKENPFVLFKQWFDEILNVERSDPTAMVLSTVDEKGHPDSRVVLLKGIEEEKFIFYTNYESNKAQHLERLPYAALNFYWPELCRQVRIRGLVKKTTAAQSDAYFASRPLESQLSAIASPQSRPILNREVLEADFKSLKANYQKKQQMTRPKYWGGYYLIPTEIEFWQGRDKRLHDRLQYYKDKGKWRHRRLAP